MCGSSINWSVNVRCPTYPPCSHINLRLPVAHPSSLPNVYINVIHKSILYAILYVKCHTQKDAFISFFWKCEDSSPFFIRKVYDTIGSPTHSHTKSMNYLTFTITEPIAHPPVHSWINCFFTPISHSHLPSHYTHGPHTLTQPRN